MVGDKTMSQRIAIGVGCRAGCDASAIEQVVLLALERAPGRAPLGLFTIADKRGEAGLTEAARRLGFSLVHLPRYMLLDQAASVETTSPASARAFGVPSVAEASALAGAGRGAVLLVTRIAQNGATCAVAGAPELPA
jgi:cobalt-precorrin 5A hydrolase